VELAARNVELQDIKQCNVSRDLHPELTQLQEIEEEEEKKTPLFCVFSPFF